MSPAATGAGSWRSAQTCSVKFRRSSLDFTAWGSTTLHGMGSAISFAEIFINLLLMGNHTFTDPSRFGVPLHGMGFLGARNEVLDITALGATVHVMRSGASRYEEPKSF